MVDSHKFVKISFQFDREFLSIRAQLPLGKTIEKAVKLNKTGKLRENLRKIKTLNSDVTDKLRKIKTLNSGVTDKLFDDGFSIAGNFIKC